jgi:hypothetical protein
MVPALPPISSTARAFHCASVSDSADLARGFGALGALALRCQIGQVERPG